jgi:glyoxylase-like metal-dependent hydrolase (beta-lactamase superfamily II)
MQIGRYRITLHNHGFFRLDGGAMFGSVPKTLWARDAPPDDENRILLATRSLVIDDANRRLLVDVGCGDKWNEKSRQIFCIASDPYQPVPGVTDVLLTHLHFDHAGGVSCFLEGQPTPNYPRAKHFVSQINFENARNPHRRERASYLPENVDVLKQVDLVLTQNGQEIWPGISVHQCDGHTRGLQWVKVADTETTLAFPTDLIPSSKHLPVPYVMGYDMCAEVAMAEKESFLQQAVDGNWIVVFEHDPAVAAGRISFDEQGRPTLLSSHELTE